MAINETLKAISDPVRRDILQMLKSGKKSAGEIAEKFNVVRTTIQRRRISSLAELKSRLEVKKDGKNSKP